MKDIKKYTLRPEASIREALKKIDSVAIGQVFIVDDQLRLLGIATDGDVRRALLRGATLNESITAATNFKPFFVKIDTPIEKVNALFDSSFIKTLPVVDEQGVLLHFIDKYRERLYLPIAKPIFQGNELKYVTDALLSGWVSSVGQYVTDFEKKFARFCGTKYAVTTSNGTTALHLALLALGVGEGDEVILPSFTFISTANAVRYVRAKPIFVDIEDVYWQIDPKKIEAAITKKTKAIIPVHLYGHPSKIDDIVRIARKHKLFIIEDAAEAIGAEVKGKKVGTWGDIAIFSFFGNKIITTGEGGMVVTNNRSIAEQVAMLRDHGMSRTKRYIHELLGYNYRMTNLQAALGLAQLERISEILKRKIKVARWYDKYLKGIDGVQLHQEAPWAKCVYWMYSIVLDENIAISRDELITELKKRGVETRPFFPPIHKQPIYDNYTKIKLPTTESVSKRGLNLPSSVQLTEADIKHIATTIASILTGSNRRQR